MDRWIDKILIARDSLEIVTGHTPTHIMVRPEIWPELSEDGSDVVEIDGMIVGVADGLRPPFILLISLNILDAEEI